MLQWPVLEMTMMLNLIHSRTKGLEYPTHEEYSHGASLCIPWIPKSPNHQITQFQVFVFRYSGSVVRYGHSCLGIQAQYSGLCFSIHIQGIQVHVFTFRHSGLGIQAWIYRQVCTPKPEL